MEIVILDGDPCPDDEVLSGYLQRVQGALEADGHHVQRFVLRDLDIPPCTGCWSCWLRTPGRCVSRDRDDDVIRRAYLHADLVLYASPVELGFLAAPLKNVIDKLIPLFHPYIRIREGECTHHHRYRLPQPVMAGLLHPRPDTDAEDLRLCHDYLARTAWHFESPVAFNGTTQTPVDEVVARLVARKEGGARCA